MPDWKFRPGNVSYKKYVSCNILDFHNLNWNTAKYSYSILFTYSVSKIADTFSTGLVVLILSLDFNLTTHSANLYEY